MLDIIELLSAMLLGGRMRVPCLEILKLVLRKCIL